MGLFDDIGNFFTGDQDNADFKAWEDLQAQLAGATKTGMKPWLDDPTYKVAPMNPYQMAANGGALGLLGKGSGGSYADEMAKLPGVSVNDIYGYADPLADLMVERGQNQLDQSFSRSATDIGQRASAGGAFGGSREAVQRGMLDETMADASKDLALGADAAAYGMGAQLATGNADRRLNALGSADASRLAGLGLDAQTLGLLNAFGDRQYQYDQNRLDAPYTTATRLYGLLSGNPPQEEASGFQTLLGYLAGNAGNAMRFLGGGASGGGTGGGGA